MLLADTLSKTYLENSQHSVTKVKVECTHARPDHRLREFQKETTCKVTLLTKKQSGMACQQQSTAVFYIQDDGIIFNGMRWIILQTLRQHIKQKLQDSHIGLQGCLHRAQETVYWPGINGDTTDYIPKLDAGILACHFKVPDQRTTKLFVLSLC